MNQVSAIGFGVDATRLAGYAQTANERLGNVDFVFENTGDKTLYVKVQAFDGTSTPSGYANITPIGASAAAFLVVARGVITKSFCLLSKRIGFFGSGATNADGTGAATSTKCNISASLRNKADLRGGQIDISVVGHQGWGYDQAFNYPELTKQWGSVNSGTGLISPTGKNFGEA